MSSKFSDDLSKLTARLVIEADFGETITELNDSRRDESEDESVVVVVVVLG